MADYHRYIYDTENRKIIGDFEQAYQSCEDTWPTQHHVHLLKYQSVLHMMRQRPQGARLADIGAGYGDFVALLVSKGLDATGFEISATAVDRGRARFGLGDRLQVGDLKRGIPAADASFDIVTLFGVFWFLLDCIPDAMAEVRRILRPGGTFIASLTMVTNPIGRETIGSYDDFLNHLRRYFVLDEATLAYSSADLQARRPVAECETDMIAYCHAK
jgi:SAM-dependent methyltransferase